MSDRERVPPGAAAPPRPEDVVRLVLAELEARADPAAAAEARRYFKASDRVEFFGLSTAALREVEAGAARAIGKSWTYREALRFCEILLAHPRHEARAAGLLVLLRYAREFPRGLFGRVKGWLATDRLSNWALVDIFCPAGLGGLIRRFPDLGAEIVAWARHRNRWVRRAAAVSFVPLARRGEFLAEAYAAAEALLPSGDDLVRKATGWLLREAGKPDPARLERFLREKGPAVPRTALRYAIERLPAAKREDLLAATRGPSGRRRPR